MISYEAFKRAVRSELKNYLPQKYADYELQETKIYKINRCVDSFRLQPPGPAENCGPMPTLNYQDMYRAVVGGAKLEKVMQCIAQTMQFHLPPDVESSCQQLFEEDAPQTDMLHVALINRKRNREYLRGLPHVDFLDLAAIAYLEGTKGSGYLCVVTKDIQKQMGLGDEELLKTACENTFRDYPSFLEDSHLGLNAWCPGSSFGAVCLLDKEMLREAAERLDSDLYVLPDSLHLLFLIAARSVPRQIVMESFFRANLLEPDAGDFLSDNVYYYDRSEGSLRILTERTGRLS